MPIVRVDDVQDPRLAEYVQVTHPDWLLQRGVFVAEGRLVVRRLLAHPGLRVRSLLLSESALSSLEDGLIGLPSDPTVYLCENAQLRQITGFSIHQGCLALGERPAELDPAELIESSARLVALEDVGNADNVGGIFRNAAAFGADAVLLSPRCCDPLYRKAIRTSMGTSLRVPFAYVRDWPDGLEVIRRTGGTRLALTARADAVDIAALDPTSLGRVTLLLGHEGRGLGEACLARADRLVRIPMAPGHDSLNVATASGIAMHRLFGGSAPGAIRTGGDA